ncbi:MAG: M48 family peptidase [Wenzhouxiangellaceae bacterium]|nr:MAG: M48 family peptidase [Wenzhouxiangellaceae bacterium]
MQEHAHRFAARAPQPGNSLQGCMGVATAGSGPQQNQGCRADVDGDRAILAGHEPSPGSAGLSSMNRIWLKFALGASIVMVCGLAAGQQRVMLPDMGGTSTRVLSPEMEQTFARDFERYMRAHNLLVEDPMIRDHFEDMGFRLVSHSDRPAADFHFFVMRDPGINAFASVAGVIGINAGLILLAHDESEVAGVVAHEIAHVTQDHIARAVENQQQVSMPAMLATIGVAIAAGLAGASPDASQAVLMSGMGLAQQLQINHTRQSEAEADRVGIGLLARAGYDPHGMTRFFERLSMHSRAMGSGPPEYLRTHPLTVNRIAEARDRAESIATRPRIEDQQFHFVQSRLRVLMAQNHDQNIQWFRARMDRGERPADAMRYGLALSMIRGKHFDQAETEVASLLASDPDRQLFRLLEADLRLAQGRQADAVDILAELYRHFPGNRMVATQYAETLMHQPEPDLARRTMTILRPYLRAHPNDLRMTELMARAANVAGEPVRAAEAVADSYYLRGGVTEAIDQLERVSGREDLDFYQRARISARLAELRSEQVRLMTRAR